ncbi:MAG: HAMP domain-containing protein [Melioribacteraceae bacterium]|nr:HAMP domain-containing protein [Melioribacteraceae bacterium]
MNRERITILSKSIAFKTAIFAWILIIVTIILFVVFSLPYQDEVILNRMKTEANDLVSSIINSNAPSLMIEDYHDIIDFQLNLIERSKSILYIVIVKRDGFAILFKKDNWEIDNLTDKFWLPDKSSDPQIVFSSLVNREVFNYSHNFVYSGIDWGWIHVGLSLDSYYEAKNTITIRTVFLAAVLTIIGFITSLFFATRFTKPITLLNDIVKRISEGNLSVTSGIKTGDELESLSNSVNKMTVALNDSRTRLEQRVKERTAELAETNAALMKEVKERIKTQNSLNKYTLRLEALQEIYRNIISAKSTKEIIFDTFKTLNAKLLNFDKISIMMYDNESYTASIHSMTKISDELTSISEEISIDSVQDIDKFNGLNLIYKKNLDKELSLTFLEKKMYDIGLKSYTTFPMKIQNEILGEFIIARNEPNSFSEDEISIIIEIGSQLAIAIAQSRLEEQLSEHAKNLQDSLKEKVVLLKEIHHRVKNNLQIISSLLYLQSRKIDDPESLAIFADSQNRVKSMALVHEKLYNSDDLSSVNFSEYIRNLGVFVSNSYKTSSKNIKIIYDLKQVFVSVETAIPLGLIINELLSNSFKYAFPDSFKAETEMNVYIILRTFDNQLEIEIGDNGIGLPKDLNIKETKSLGLQLVQNLIDQLDADLTIENENGTFFKIRVKN